MSINGTLESPPSAAAGALPAVLDAAPVPVALNGITPNGVHHIFPSNAVLELADGFKYEGVSFGATGKGVAGECVFQTGKLKF